MSFQQLSDRLTDLLGVDVGVTYDDHDNPSQIRLYRPDPIADSLVQDAIGRARQEFPEEMRTISAVLISFEDALGPTRRRVTVG
ncbi:hypothetical protein [Pinisolibacter aquiterrae]|uniref:hypothetical protein n=1 Tax=Pinisolibacter aquiterrae TaxID=2815579 RepID=UPI001C3DEC85|nr:hypothetical protein [Pinisolibacter aquiterrae]MBV5264471.1 hypothetical protein [Pinisolibacter aquiterrae]MCC8234380.1 hypothetical protein [Pinisolibacter aquiterrae]